MSLSTLYAQLRRNPSGQTYTVAPVPWHANVYLGVDNENNPVLFVRALESTFEPPLRTNKVTLQLGQEFRFFGERESRASDLLHSLSCHATEEADVSTFLLLVEAFLLKNKLGALDREALVTLFRSMIRLFSVNRAKNLYGEQLGLWGELFMMRSVRGYRFWAPFWHRESRERFDFSFSRYRVEVKTTTIPERIHHFSHRQIYGSDDEEILIASLLMAENDEGLSLKMLITECRTALRATTDYYKIERAVRRAGMDCEPESGPTFDEGKAEMSLSWFCSADVPHFRMPEPAGVSETRYRVDLSTAPKVCPHELKKWLRVWDKSFANLSG